MRTCKRSSRTSISPLTQTPRRHHQTDGAPQGRITTCSDGPANVFQTAPPAHRRGWFMTVNEISFFTPLLAVVFGLLSFASPCCLPLLPAYLGLLAGSSTTAGAAGGGRRRLLRNGLGFVAGLS